MKGEIIVRRATPEDVEVVRELDPWLPYEILERKLAAHEIVLAERGGEPVGFVRIEYLWAHVPFIALIRVVESARRQGVGRALVRFLEVALRDTGEPWLLSSSQANEAEPQAWHRQIGFEECGFLAAVNEGGIGEVFFRKRLV